MTSVASEAHIALMKKAQTDFVNKAKYNDVEKNYQVLGKQSAETPDYRSLTKGHMSQTS